MSDYSIHDVPYVEPTDFPQALELITDTGPRMFYRVPGQDDRRTIYDYVLRWSDWLNNSGHWVRFEISSTDNPLSAAGRIVICKPAKYSGWISYRWKVVSPQSFDRNIAAQRQRLPHYVYEKLQCRNTVRGRKQAKHIRVLVNCTNSIIRFYERRKALLLEGKTYGPQYLVDESREAS
jgi:hypothetical protein